VSSNSRWVHEAKFQPVASSVSQARAFVRGCLAAHGQRSLVEDARLVVSELLTNAVIDSQSPIAVRLERVRHHVVLTVKQRSPHSPRLLVAGHARRVGGAGRRVLDYLTSSWGAAPSVGGEESAWASFVVSGDSEDSGDLASPTT
jgi:hypothetical protein